MLLAGGSAERAGFRLGTTFIRRAISAVLSVFCYHRIWRLVVHVALYRMGQQPLDANGHALFHEFVVERLRGRAKRRRWFGG